MNNLGTSTIWVACIQHLVWAVLLFTDDPTTATPIHWLSLFVSNKILLGSLLALVSLLTMISLLQRDGPTHHVMLVVPQQTIMLLSAFGAAIAIYSGKYADGTVVSRTHLGADQSVYIVAATIHTLAVFQLWRQTGR